MKRHPRFMLPEGSVDRRMKNSSKKERNRHKSCNAMQQSVEEMRWSCEATLIVIAGQLLLLLQSDYYRSS